MKNGFILVTFLIFLLILSLLASHAMQNSLLQHKMSHNFSLRDKLFYQTERVLRLAETAIQQQDRWLCDISEQSIAANYILQKDLATLPSCRIGSGHYVIQKIHATPQITCYRVSAWTSEGNFIIQSTYAKIKGKSMRFSWRVVYTIYQ